MNSMALTKRTVAVNPGVELAAERAAFSWVKLFLMLFAIVTVDRIQQVIPTRPPRFSNGKERARRVCKFSVRELSARALSCSRRD